MSDDPNQEYFSDGLTEQIINGICKVSNLFVIARNSSFAYRGKAVSVKQIAKELGVRYILEGSVRKYGNKVRVGAQLIKASDGFNVFSEVYDEELKDIFQVQDQISSKIAQKFTQNVGLTARAAKLVAASTENMEAYELYLKGRFNFSKASLEATRTAISYFEAAIRKDRDFVLPLAGAQQINCILCRSR